jgi:isoquinoline 1-oxidoreductase alpha subunit
MAIELTLNQQPVRFAGDPAMPLLWFLRDHARLTGTKFGCGIGYCGACTVHVDQVAVRACVTPMTSVAGRTVTTIEGLAHEGLLCGARRRGRGHGAGRPEHRSLRVRGGRRRDRQSAGTRGAVHGRGRSMGCPRPSTSRSL